MRTGLVLAILLAALAVPAASGPALAASFDCARAGTVFERTICGHAPLDAADEALAVAYATATGGLSEAALAQMRAGQRRWLAFAEAACIAEGGHETLEARGDCLVGLFRARIRALEASRMLGGYRFYLTSAYAALPDPFFAEEPDSPWRVATHAVHVPRMDGAGATGRAFNAMIDSYLDGLGLGRDGTIADPEESSDTELTLVVATVAAEQRIVIEETSYWYGHGAAHGNYALNYLHFLVEEGREMQPDDLFAGTGWQETFYDLVMTALRDEHDDILFEDAPEFIDAAALADPRRWILSDSGLAVQFQPYEVAPYAYGAPTATVGWEALEPLLSARGRELRWTY